jgi:membrane protease YdiL (CAAX protease family)
MNTSQLNNLFFPPHGHRLRAGWRLLGWLLLMLLFLFVGIFLTALVLAIVHLKLNPFTTLNVLVCLQMSATLGAIRIVDPAFGTQCIVPVRWRDAFFGIVFAFAMLGYIFWGMISFGWIRIVAMGGLAWEYLPLFMLIAVYEEFLFRGFILQMVAKSSKIFWGMLVSSIAFGLAHANNPGGGLAPVLGIFAAGLLFGWAAVRTKTLWLCIGLHFGWNLFEGLIFGFPTSGLMLPAVLTLHINGPILWTGGAFGPEAGLILLPGLMLGALLVWVYTK